MSDETEKIQRDFDKRIIDDEVKRLAEEPQPPIVDPAHQPEPAPSRFKGEPARPEPEPKVKELHKPEPALSRFKGEPPFDKHPQPEPAPPDDSESETEPAPPEPAPKEDHPELPPPPRIDVKVMINLVQGMAKKGLGAPIQGAGAFQDSGYIFHFDLTTVRVRTDGWLDFHITGQPNITIPLTIQQLMALTQGVSALALAGHVAAAYKGGEG